jgi:hypothetical protein
MKRLTEFLLLFLITIPALAMERVNIACSQGAKALAVPGVINQTTVNLPMNVVGSYPGATVTVFYTGGSQVPSNLVFSDNTGDILGNPFSCDSTGFVYFYVAKGTYDVTFSGPGITTPFTVGAIMVCDWTTETCGSGAPPVIATGYFNVQTYGAVGNGTTNDTADIQSAETAALASGNCPVIYFPPTSSCYLVTPSVLTFTKCVKLVGATGGELGIGSSICDNSTNGNILAFNQGSQGFAVDGLALYDMVTPTVGDIIDINMTSSTDGSGLIPGGIHNVSIGLPGPTSGCWNGVHYQHSNHVTFDHLIIFNCASTDFFDDAGFDATITDSIFTNLQTNTNVVSFMATTASAVESHNLQTWGGNRCLEATAIVDFLFDQFVCDVPNAQGVLIHSTAGQNIFTNSWVGGSATSYGIDLLGDVSVGGSLPKNIMGFDYSGLIRSNHSAGVHLSSQIQNVFFHQCKASANGQGGGSNPYAFYADVNSTGYEIDGCRLGPDSYDNETQTMGLYTQAATSALQGNAIPWIFTNNTNTSTLYPLAVDNTGVYSLKEIHGNSGLSPMGTTAGGTIAASGSVTIALDTLIYTPVFNAESNEAIFSVVCGLSGNNLGSRITTMKVPSGAMGSYTANSVVEISVLTGGGCVQSLSGNNLTLTNLSSTNPVAYAVYKELEHDTRD